METSKKKTTRKETMNFEFGLGGVKSKKTTKGMVVFLVVSAIVLILGYHFSKTTTKTTKSNGEVVETTSMTLRQKH